MLRQAQHERGGEGFVWPPVRDDPDGLRALVATLEATQWLRAEEIARHQHAQLAAAARHHAAHSPAFAARLAAAGLTPDDLAQALDALPSIGRRDLQSGEGLFAAVVPPSHGAVRAAATSGSTGEPVSVRRTALNQLDWLALTMRLHAWHPVPQPARFAALRARLPGVVEHPDWGPPASLFLATGALLAIPNDRALEEQAARLAAFAPDILLAYPSNIDGLLRLGAAIRPRQVRTIGETLHPDLAARIEAQWGARAIDCYSSEEAGYLALRCPDSPLYHVPETIMVDILDEDDRPVAPGAEGRVVVTDQRNFATPLIRYAIGDRAVAGGPCPCGRGLPTIARIAGRERNLILMPDGTRHWPITGRDGYRAIAPIVQFQMIQTGRALIEVRLVTERPLTGGEETALAAHMARALGHGFGLDFHYYAGELPRGPTGKLEEFVCRVGEGRP